MRKCALSTQPPPSGFPAFLMAFSMWSRVTSYHSSFRRISRPVHSHPSVTSFSSEIAISGSGRFNRQPTYLPRRIYLQHSTHFRSSVYDFVSRSFARFVARCSAEKPAAGGSGGDGEGERPCGGDRDCTGAAVRDWTGPARLGQNR